MNIHKKLAVTTSGVACLLTTMGAAPATAATFNFSYSGNNATASGVLTTDPYDPTTNSYEIIGITGTRNGVSINSLLPPNSLLGNDNLLLAGSPRLDEYGFAYTTASQSYNVFHTYSNIEIAANFTGQPLTSFSVTPSAVPEPSLSLGILSIGALTVGNFLRQKFKQG